MESIQNIMQLSSEEMSVPRMYNKFSVLRLNTNGCLVRTLFSLGNFLVSSVLPEVICLSETKTPLVDLGLSNYR